MGRAELGDIVELLAVAPAEFVAARNARAKELRVAGDKDRAAIIAKLRRPSATTWAVNAAVRADRAGVQQLVDAVRVLQEPGSVDVRAATRTLDTALDALVDEAARAMDEIGTKPTADRKAEVRTALRAAALAEDPSALLEARIEDADSPDPDDTLAAALRAGAHGAGRARRSFPSPSAASKAPSEPPRKELRAALAQARAEQTAAKETEREAERELRRVRRELEVAERAVARARSAVEQADAVVEARQADLDGAGGD